MAGGRVPRHSSAGLGPLFFLSGPSRAAPWPAMTDLQDLVELSLLPSWWWRTASERLRAGESPRDVRDQLLAEHPAYIPGVSTLRSRAVAGLSRAGLSGLAP